MRRLCLLIVVAPLCAASGVPAAAVAQPPAIDQYKLELPAGGGGKSLPAKPPSPRPDLLPRRVRDKLSGADGRELITIATSPDLGAPQTVSGDRPRAAQSGTGAALGQSGTETALVSSKNGIPVILADSLSGGYGLVLVLSLAAIAAIALRKQLGLRS
jgi:hypothetical protein